MPEPYASYHRSGIEWVPQIPSGWKVAPLYSILRLVKRSNSPMTETNLLSLSYGSVIEKDIASMDGLLPESFATYQIVHPGDLVFRFTDLQNDKRSLRSALVKTRGIITSAYLATSPSGIDSTYVSYLMRSYDLSKVFYGMGGGLRQSLKYGDVKHLPIVLPPEAEQRQIVTYLNRETARIEALIQTQERFAALLAERRRAIPSELLGHLIGEGERLKWNLCEVDERAANQWSRLPLLSVSINWGVKRRASITSDLSRADDLSRFKICRMGDLVVNRMRAFQGAIGIAAEDGVVSPDYSVIRVGDQLCPEWLELLMRTPDFIAEMSSRIRGIGGTDSGNVRTPRLNIQDLFDIRVRIPSIETQRELLTEWTKDRHRIDTLIEKVQSFIHVTKERRAALITAAVTGQIDVRKEAIDG